jgi:hypothetical protein
MYQYQPSPQFAGQTRPQYDSSFAQQYPNPFLQNQQTQASHHNYAQSSGYQTNYLQEQFHPQPYYQHQQQPGQNYSAPYTQSQQAYAGLSNNLSPYSQSYGSRHTTNQPPGQMRQGGSYFFGPAIQTGGETLFSGTLPPSSSYAPPSVPGKTLVVFIFRFYGRIALMLMEL